MDAKEIKVEEMVIKFNGKEIKGTPDDFKKLKSALDDVFGKSIVYQYYPYTQPYYQPYYHQALVQHPYSYQPQQLTTY